MKFKAALVTGAGARIGREIALMLRRNGVNVAVHYASSDKGALETVEQLDESCCCKLWTFHLRINLVFCCFVSSCGFFLCRADSYPQPLFQVFVLPHVSSV